MGWFPGLFDVDPDRVRIRELRDESDDLRVGLKRGTIDFDEADERNKEIQKEIKRLERGK